MEAGHIWDNCPHYLDHLAPFCALLGWPLYVCDPKLADIARQFYPDLTVYSAPLFSFPLPSIVVSCEPKACLEALFIGQNFAHFWLPHGHSDKGWKTPFFSPLQKETAVFVYGEEMIERMKESGLCVPFLKIGNFRAHYYEKHHLFYQDLWPLSDTKENILYAPTWEDRDQNGSFWSSFSTLLPLATENRPLFIKLHPNTWRRFEVEIKDLMSKEHRHVHFLASYPPIYPLLAKCLFYLGDLSSIGYDFLFFNRPLYFPTYRKELPLHKVGRALEDFGKEDPLQDALDRKNLYEKTFAPHFHPSTLLSQIHALC